ncbi:MAG: cation-transporting P-type ATPase, partial [Planctomycetales bacterium]|nr:cation-transporting P-type ATPase [Planctomycetales bacterium]
MADEVHVNATYGEIHSRNVADVYRWLDSRERGLRLEEVATRQRVHGLNRLPRAKRFRVLKSLGRHFGNFFSILLDVAAAVCFLAHRMEPGEGMQLLGVALMAVSILNATFSLIQELRAEHAMEELAKFLPPTVNVRRDGKLQQLLAEQLVPGDLLIVADGDKIAADARLVVSESLLVSNAALTGESRALAMSERPSRMPFHESANILFAGAVVMRGSGEAVVFATGAATAFGKVAALSCNVIRPVSPLQLETRRMIRALTVVAVTMGLSFFVYGVASGRSVWTNIVFMLGIIVANVPEGLLPTFTLALSMASLRMAKKHVLVKNLEAVEGLGAVHVICTDKTGTLTRNELAIASLVEPSDGQPLESLDRQTQMLSAALIASQLRATGPSIEGCVGRWSGDPLDVAVARKYEAVVGDPALIIKETVRHFPFDLAKRREAGVFDDGQQILFAVKGAWESLRPLIGHMHVTGGTVEEADEALLSVCDGHVKRLAELGQRVIAVAYRRLTSPPHPKAAAESLERGLVLLGFMAIDDPLREQVPQAIAQCQSAGIRTIMVTGDHPDTAFALGRKCGMVGNQQSYEQAIVTGSELELLPQYQLAQRLHDGAVIFARTTPEQKMKIVAALKQLEYVVAMTGDGV